MKLLGQIKDNNDPEKANRLKISIPGYSDKIETENLEWIEQSSTTIKNSSMIPDIDEWVEVNLEQNTTNWRWPDLKDKELSNLLGEDYLKSIVFGFRNLDKQGGAGKLALLWTKTEGFQMLVDDSMYQIRDDRSLFMTDSKKIIHVKDHISLGSEDKSAEPAVLGDKNFDALNAINDYIKALATTISTYQKQLSAVATPNPYTTALAPIFTAMAAELDALHVATNYSTTKAKFPPTKSTIVSLD